MLLLYFRTGINILDVIKIMELSYNFIIDPLHNSIECIDGDPECTRRCSGWATFPELTLPLQIRLYGISLRSDDEIYLRPRWNPNMDTKIHMLGVSPVDSIKYALYPDRYVVWDEAKKHSPILYLIYKKLFVLFSCDEAQVLYRYSDPLLHWVRSSNFQVCINEYERGNEMTLEQCLAFDQCRQIYPTEQIFPEIAKEYETKYL